nr:hypothetical protein DM860_010431 [Ipomoea batatas]
MEQNAVVNFRHGHGRSTSTDRFLGVFSPPKADSAIGGAGESDASLVGGGDELNEDDVLWTGRDFTEPQLRSNSGSLSTPRQAFKKPENFGILAALPEQQRKGGRPVIYQKHATTSFSRDIPSIPKPAVDREQSYGYNRNFSQSMPATNGGGNAFASKHSTLLKLNVPMYTSNFSSEVQRIGYVLCGTTVELSFGLLCLF